LKISRTYSTLLQNSGNHTLKIVGLGTMNIDWMIGRSPSNLEDLHVPLGSSGRSKEHVKEFPASHPTRATAANEDPFWT